MARREKRALPAEVKEAAAAQRPRRSSRLSSTGDANHPCGRAAQQPSAELSSPNQSAHSESLWWHTLPRDVLRIIFSYISFRPRILVVAFVCRRWNRCVEESVDALPQYIPAAAAARAMARWPQISIVNISATPSFSQHAPVFSALAQAKSLSSLDLRGISQRRHVCTESAPCRDLLRITGLTRLAMQLYDCHGLTGLIAQNVASLRSLSVDCNTATDHIALNLIPFSSLTSFSWSDYYTSDSALLKFVPSLVSMLVSQHTSLVKLSLKSIVGLGPEIDRLAAAGLPSLRNLKIRHAGITGSSLGLLIRSAPSLCSLKLILSMSFRAFVSLVPLLAPVLRVVKLPEIEKANVRQLIPTLQQCTNLTELLPPNSFRLASYDFTKQWVRINLSIAMRLSSLTLDCSDLVREQWQVLSLISSCISLVHLNILLPRGFPPTSITPWRLPCLETLLLNCEHHSLDAAVEISRAFLAAAEWLIELRLKPPHFRDEEFRMVLPKLEKMLVHAARRTLQMIEWVSMVESLAESCHRVYHHTYGVQHAWVSLEFRVKGT